MTTGAETGATQPQVMECQQPPEAGTGKECMLPTSLQSQYLDARIFHSCENKLPLFFKHQVCGNLLRQPQETNTHFFHHYLMSFSVLPILTFFGGGDSFANFSRNLLTLVCLFLAINTQW